MLLAAMGSPDLRQIDGLGGADTLTSKVAIVSKSNAPGVDVDYLFCQVDIGKPVVDTGPICGNMLSGVAPFALEMGIVPAKDGKTEVVIYDSTPRARSRPSSRRPAGRSNTSAMPRSTACPARPRRSILNFMEVVGSKTGSMVPTGQGARHHRGHRGVVLRRRHADDADAREGPRLDRHEGRAEIDGNKALLARIETIRMEAGRRMGFGDVTDSVIPKVGPAVAAARRRRHHLALSDAACAACRACRHRRCLRLHRLHGGRLDRLRLGVPPTEIRARSGSSIRRVRSMCGWKRRAPARTCRSSRPAFCARRARS